MAVIKCKMCGGDLVLIEGQSVAECEYCGSRQTVPNADNEKKLNLFASANRLRAACEFDRAAGIYDAIKAEFPGEAEAYWGLVLCKYGIEYVDDPATGKKVPTCHCLSYDSVMDDTNLELAMDYADAVARKVYREEAKHLEKIRTGILEVSSKEKPYDIFICYKETDPNGDRTLDSVLAQDLYSALMDKGYRVFFSRITLQSKLGEAYEPYIFAALNSAKVMLAIGTDPEYYNAVWVKNEWSRYLKICAADKAKHLIPCYKDLDAYDMPKEFRPLQGVDLGKMGAVQDILFNMEKYIPLKKQNAPVIHEKVVVGGSGGSNKIASLLDRGNMALEDGNWAKADSFFEDVLNNDSRNAQAYIGKTLAMEKCRTMDALKRKRLESHPTPKSEALYIPERTTHVGEMAARCSLLGYVDETAIRNLYNFDRSYASLVSGRQQQYQEEKLWWENHRQLSRAEKFASGPVAENLKTEKQHLFSQLADRVKKAQEADAHSVARLEAAYDAHVASADATAEKLYIEGLTCRENDYKAWLSIIKNTEKLDQLKQGADFFAGQKDYQDSRNLAEHCRKRIDDITAEQKRKEAERKAAEDLEAEKRRIAEEKAVAKRKKRNKVIGIISGITAVIAVAVFFVMTKVVIPSNNYKAAEELLAAEQYEEAIAAFESMGNYKDSSQRVAEARYAIAEKLLTDGHYEQAIVAFEEMGSYKDASSRAAEAQDAFMEARYANAEELLNNGKYAEAIEAYQSLQDYRDSADKTKEATYLYALTLLDQGNVSDAYTCLQGVKEYADAALYLNNFVFLPVSITCETNTGGKEVFTFEYNAQGQMTGSCRNALGTNEPVYYFDDNGSLLREEWNSGFIAEYSTDSFGIVTCTDMWGKPKYIFDAYGNRISFYLNGERHEYQGYVYDEWHNRKDNAINTYNENGTLQSVCYREGNLQIQTNIQYQQVYILDGARVEDDVWKNIRIICGEAVWYY